MGRPVLAGGFVVMFRGQFPYCLSCIAGVGQCVVELAIRAGVGRRLMLTVVGRSLLLFMGLAFVNLGPAFDL
jgi:hypothetical protein